jgi:hypothetical protein
VALTAVYWLRLFDVYVVDPAGRPEGRKVLSDAVALERW